MKPTTLKMEIVKAPALKSGRDSKKVAAELDALMTDAEQGLRRIVRAGLYIIEVSEDLPHGQLEPWIKTYLPHRSRRTFFSWKQLTMGILNTCGVKVQQLHFSTPLRQLLDTKTKDAAPVREKIEKLIEGKTARGLFSEFKTCEVDDDGNLVAKNGSGKYHALRADGSARRARRTKKELSQAEFEEQSATACALFAGDLEEMLKIQSPRKERAWEPMDHAKFDALVDRVTELREAMRATQERRKALARTNLGTSR